MRRGENFTLVSQFGFLDSQRHERLEQSRIDQQTSERLRELRKILEPGLPAVVDAFYAHLGRFPEAMRIVDRAGSTVERLKKTNPGYFDEIFRAEFDANYFESRLRVGMIHARIGLTPQWFFAAMTTYIDELYPTILRAYRWNPQRAGEALCALQKALTLDQMLVVESYIEFGYIAKIRERVGLAAENIAEGGGQLKLAADEAGLATQEVATSAERLAHSAHVQTSAATRAATSMGVLTSTSDEMAKAAEAQRQALSFADATVRRVSKHLGEVERQAAIWSTVKQRVQDAARLRETVDHASACVVEMQDGSRKIGQIVQTIEAIANQTNLLALNAAIEAARAGEHGRGFAVVADEVRKLAEGSSASAKEIVAIVQGIQRGSEAAVSAMERTGVDVRTTLEVTDESAGVLESISIAVGQLSDVSQRMDEAMLRVNQLGTEHDEQLNSVISEIARATEAIESFAHATVENSASAEELSATAEEMSAQVEELVASVVEMEHHLTVLRDVAQNATAEIVSTGLKAA